MKRHKLIFIFILSTWGAIFAQPEIKFEKDICNLDNIKEEDGKTVCNFEFTNEGNAPLVIAKVQSSCGCAVANWTKNPVEPGQKGIINVIFTPMGHSGKFSKSISVYSNAREKKSVLRIEGNLITDDDNSETVFPETAIVKTETEQIPEEIKSTYDTRRNAPIIQYSTKMLDLGTLKADTKAEGKIILTNKGINPLMIKSVTNENKEIIIAKPLNPIPSDSTDEIRVYVDTQHLRSGTYRRTFTIQTNDPNDPIVLFGILWKIE